MSLKALLVLFLVLLVLLILRFFTFFQGSFKYEEGEPVSFETRVSEDPLRSLRGQKLSVELPSGQRAFTTLETIPEVRYGDLLSVEGKVTYFETESGDKIALLNYPSFQIKNQQNRLAMLYKVRERLIYFFNSNFSPTFSALLLGIVFGIKEEMPKHFSDNLRDVGLTHVIAASGMNITMVGGFMVYLFGLFLRRQVALIASIIGILFYAFLAGFEPSIVRASIMGILVFSAQIIGRQQASFIGLLLAGFVMLFASPNLIFDVGFQLSFMATLGLIFIGPVFYQSKKITKVIRKSFIGEDIITTVSAQIATLPILLSTFGSYSLLSILVNAVLLWTIPFIMIIGGISAILALIFMPLARLTSYLSLPLLIYFESTVEFFGRFDSSFDLTFVPGFLFVGYYLVVLAIIFTLKRRKE